MPDLADPPGRHRRLLPELTPENRPYWTGGAEGELLVARCGDCGTWIQPPTPACWSCRSMRVAPEPVSGRGTIHALTINHHEWVEGHTPPYAVALVELDEQPGLRVPTNVTGPAGGEPAIGMPVEVHFEEHDDVWVPLFRVVGP